MTSFKKKHEDFEDAKQSRTATKQGGGFFVTLVMIVIFVLSAIYAAILSWRCNTSAGVHVAVKVVFAFFAALGNVGYLIFYALYQLNTCTLLKRVPAPPSEEAPDVPAPIVPVSNAAASNATQGGRRRR